MADEVKATNNLEPLRVLITGGGVAGLSAALALTKHFTSAQSPLPKIDILEVRHTLTSPHHLGGAINLTPNALRYLDQLGVLSLIRERKNGCDINAITISDLHSTAKPGKVDFRGPDGKGYGKGDSGKYKALRILRHDLITALHDATLQHKNIRLHFSVHTDKIEEFIGGVRVHYTDKEAVRAAQNPTTSSDQQPSRPTTGVFEGDLLVGGDGIHSVARAYIEPSREPSFTGIAVAIGFVPVKELSGPSQTALKKEFETSTMLFSRRGNLVLSYFMPSQDQLYVAGMREHAEVTDRAGWKAEMDDHNAVRDDLLKRFAASDSAHPELEEMIRQIPSWFIYPVDKLPQNGKWFSQSGRVVLLGDAAHAMPPGGEATGLALGDAVLLSRLLSLALKEGKTDEGFKQACAAFDKKRRVQIEKAYKTAARGWETIKNSGKVAHIIERVFFMPIFLRATKSERQAFWLEDLSKAQLDTP